MTEKRIQLEELTKTIKSVYSKRSIKAQLIKMLQEGRWTTKYDNDTIVNNILAPAIKNKNDNKGVNWVTISPQLRDRNGIPFEWGQFDISGRVIGNEAILYPHNFNDQLTVRQIIECMRYWNITYYLKDKTAIKVL